MSTNVALDINLTAINGEVRPLHEWVTTFHLASVVLDPYTNETVPGLLTRLRPAGAVPRIIATNSATEYWRGDASALHVLYGQRTEKRERRAFDEESFESVEVRQPWLVVVREPPAFDALAFRVRDEREAAGPHDVGLESLDGLPIALAHKGLGRKMQDDLGLHPLERRL